MLMETLFIPPFSPVNTEMLQYEGTTSRKDTTGTSATFTALPTETEPDNNVTRLCEEF